MANFLSSFFKKEETSVLGIDIGSSAIKLVQLKRKGGRAVLETYGALALGPYAKLEIGRATNLPPEQIVAALADILREAKTTTKKGGMAIPFSSSLMTVIEMPRVDDRQLAQMVPLEARKYIPVPIAEVSLDWSVIPRDESAIASEEEKPMSGPAAMGNSGTSALKKIPKADVLLVAIHNDTIRVHQEIVQKAALDVSFFEIEIFSSIRSVLDQGPAPVMILDMGAASTKLYVVERGIVRNSHTVNKGSQNITSAIATGLGIPVDRAEIMKRTIGWSTDPANQTLSDMISLNLDFIFSEARQTLTNYQAKHRKSIGKIVAIGGGATMKGFVELAKKNLEAPVVLGDPFGKVEAPAFLHDILRKNGPEFAVAIGLALRKLQSLE